MVVYSEAYERTLAVKQADEAVCIAPLPASQSYLVTDRIIAAAEICDVDAIHPGYGFLAKNAHFADVCESCNITFIGPSAEAIRHLGDKAEARRTMTSVGMPVIPGSDAVIESEDEALRLAHDMDYPVIIKASAGGGGQRNARHAQRREPRAELPCGPE